MPDTPIDDDLEALSRKELIREVKRLRAGIRTHRDNSGHALCWRHPQLWGLLPERTMPEVAVPPVGWRSNLTRRNDARHCDCSCRCLTPSSRAPAHRRSLPGSRIVRQRSYRLELETTEGEALLSAFVPVPVSGYRAPPWLAERAAGRTVRWRVVVIDAAGRELGASEWRRLRPG